MPTKPPVLIEELLAFIESKRDEFHKMIDEDPQCAPTGSRVICTPPVLDTDDDWLVFCHEDQKQEAVDFLHQRGMTSSIEQHVYPDGIVFRLNELNLILLTDFKVYIRWVACTYWANKLNLTSKQERKLFFSSVLDLTISPKNLTL